MRQRELVALLLIWEKTVLMDYCTASTAARLEASQDLAHAPRVTLDTVEQVARSPTLAPLLPTHLRMVLTAISTALTEALRGGPQDLVFVRCVTQVTAVIIARLQRRAQPLLTRQRMVVTAISTALMVVILEVRPERALAQIVILVSEE